MSGACAGITTTVNCEGVTMDSSYIRRYHWYKDHGICVQCGQRDAEKGKTLCPECKSGRKPQVEEFLRRYYRLKEAGLCVACGKALPVDGQLKCYECREKHRATERRSNARKRRENAANATV